MADKKTVLVFPAGTEIAFEIHAALCRCKFVRLIGGTSVPCHAEFVFENCVEGFPFADDPALVDFMNRVIDDYGVDYIFPAHDSALLALSEARERLHATVIAPAKETVAICRDKNKTYADLAGADYLPGLYESADAVPGYPIFIKPAVGQGAQGARKIESREALEEALSDGVDYALCEYLPGAEFTVDCFTDRHGALRLVSPRSRDRIRAGIAVRSRVFPADERIRAIAEDLNRRLSFNGAWFFQLKRNAAGDYRLMEAAPRIAGTMGATRNRGANLPLLTLYNFWGYDVDLVINDNQELVDRAFISRFQTDIRYSRVYVDFDDTLVLGDKVNTQLIAFLYQARNEGKELYLLTRHACDVREDLRRFGIAESLFDAIYWVRGEDTKIAYIQPDSLFIDDSFAERKRVKEACGIPVFDLDMVESLLNWKS